MKKKQSWYVYFVAVISCLNLSCSVSSSQFGAFTSISPKPNMQNYYWNVTYDNLNYKLIAIDLPNGTLFADKFGNSLFFDGWAIDSIVGFGDFDGEYDIQGDEIGAVEINDEDAYIIQKNCGEWNGFIQDKNIIYQQLCGIKDKFTNKIIVNEAQEIIEIKQFIEPFGKVMILKKSNSDQ